MEEKTATQQQTAAVSVGREHVVVRIGAALAEVLHREPGGIDQDTRLFDDLGLDSTTVLEVLMLLEDDLDAEFDTNTLEQRHFESVGSLADYITSEVGGE